MRLLLDESVMWKSRTLLAINQSFELLDKSYEAIGIWKQIESWLIKNDELAKAEPDMKHWLCEVMATAQQIAH